MSRVFDCVTNAHDPQILILAFLFCVFASSTAMVIAQRGIAASGATQLGWLVAAGAVTGVGIWTTHFFGMLAYSNIDTLGFYPNKTAAALVFSIAVSVIGWLLGVVVYQRHAYVAGAVIGIGVTGAHYIDAHGIAFAGDKSFDLNLVLASLALGTGLSATATSILSRKDLTFSPLLAGFFLALGITALHLIGMAAMTLSPNPTLPSPQHVLDMSQLGEWVITAAVGIVLVGLALSIYDRHTASVVLEERRRLKESLCALTQAQEHYRAAVDLNPQISWTACPEGHCLEMGPKWAEFVGRDIQDALGTGWAAVIHSDDLENLKVQWDEALRTGSPLDESFRIQGKDGNYRWFRCRGRPRRDADGNILRWYGNLEDIHERVGAETSLRESEERYRLASCATNDLIWDWRPEIGRVEWGGAIGTCYGYPEAANGTTLAWWAERVHPDDIDRISAGLNASISGTDSNWQDEYRFRKADGTYVDILSRGYILRNQEGRAVRSIGAMMDISARKRVEDALRQAAHYDPLTGLPNRTLYHLRLEEALRQAQAEGSGFGLLLLDVDQFKHLNDTRGHDLGDKILCWIAASLGRNLPAGAMLARLGGDEFAVVIPNTSEETFCADALLSGLGAFTHGSELIEISVSAGIAFLPRDGNDRDGLFKAADLALYAAKTEGRGRVRVFHRDMRAEADKRDAMVERAKTALREDRILPFYQPKICLSTGRVVGLEALLRVNDPVQGIQSPATISAAFEDLELSVAMTDRMIAAVLADIRSWLSRGLDFGQVAINASAADFARGSFAERLIGKLREFEIPPTRIEVEVTESVFLGHNSERVAAVLKELKGEGVTISLDDFGTGYASLSHLSAFPVDVLKIDQSFIRKPGIGCASAKDRAIVRAIVGLAHNLQVRTVAEGVETVDQAAHLIELRCDMAQGFLFSRAVAASRVPYLIGKAPQEWLSHLSPQNTKRVLTA